MATTRARHHFVPHFLLKRFGSVGDAQINMMTLEGPVTRENIGLREQCRKNRFYGADGVVEDGLAKLEEAAAPVIRAIVEQRQLPAPRSAGHTALLAFLAVQRGRTPRAIQRHRRSVEALFNALSNGHNRRTGETLPNDAFPDIDSVESLEITLETSTAFARGIDDMAMHILVASPIARFICSDHPIYVYNQYCEGVRGHGVLGAACSGVQIFVPLSPEVTLMFYDQKVYRVGATRRAAVTEGLRLDEVDALNLMQFLAADGNIYFNDWRDRDRLLGLAERAAPIRRLTDPYAEQFDEDGDPNKSALTVQFDPMPDLKLDISCIKLQKHAKGRTLFERATGRRRTDILNELAAKTSLPPELLYGGPRTFRRPRGQAHGAPTQNK